MAENQTPAAKPLETKAAPVAQAIATPTAANAKAPVTPAQKAPAAKSVKSEKVVYNILKEFRDANDFSKVHEVGNEITGLGEERAAKLESLGLIEKK